MPYLNSETPFFDGSVFTTGAEALVLIRDNLTDWVVVADNVSTTESLLMRGATDNDHRAHVKFSVNGSFLEVRGDYYGDDSVLSDPLQISFNPGENNKLWLTFDNDSVVIPIRSKFIYKGAFYCGFLDRFDTSDADAWLIAIAGNEIKKAIVARAKHDGTIFKRIGDDFLNADNFASPTLNGGYQGVFDLATVANPYSSFLSSDRRNAGYSAHLGQVNKRNDRPVITRMFYLEGRGSVTGYLSSGNNPQPLYNRGYLKHIGKGFAKVPQGKIELDSRGDRYLVFGGDGLGAVKVAEGSPGVAAEVPTIFRDSINFAVTANAIAEIRNTLENAGWTLEVETTEYILMSATHSSSEKCYFKFTETSSTQLSIQGDLLGDDTKLSPAIAFTISDSITNQLHESANAQAAAISFNDDGGLWLGFLLQDGQGADQDPVWGLGLIKDGVQQTYIVVDGAWVSIADSFTVASNSLNSYPVHNSDRLTTAATPVLFYDNATATNSAYKAQNGQINGATLKAQLDFFAILSGLTSKVAYGTLAEGDRNAPKLSYHGIVDLVADGGNSLGAGETATTETGAVFRSVGGNGWNLMRSG
ncbi:hypothetical protein Xen7305DRAFT_00009110 [Xenococcus sp. PCC 7305]|uniref:hypothetical protein n=1 Tax=Xenococcus sp. PCC 7305 TaxID=102125 RepID=UPI0002ABAF0C|nr:hypothetical protein [Xenococcus sp. PCC 7305]ELS01209.1 hypothetical protein Xen7305DRAFT_00009110 [Xenococcus sp. PCC 7305]